MPLVHPGEFLLEEMMRPHGLSIYRVAKLLMEPETKISRVVHGQARIDPGLAHKLSALFGMAPETWMSWQTNYDLAREKPTKSELSKIRKAHDRLHLSELQPA